MMTKVSKIGNRVAAPAVAAPSAPRAPSSGTSTASNTLAQPQWTAAPLAAGLARSAPSAASTAPVQGGGAWAAALVAQRSPAARTPSAVDARRAAITAQLAGVTTPGRVELPGLPVAPAARGTLLVVNKGPSLRPDGTPEPGESSVMFMDLASGRVEKTVPTAAGPHEIMVSPDRTRAVAPNYGLQVQGGPLSLGGGTTLTLIDVLHREVETLPLPGYIRPHGVAWLDGDRVAITCDGTPTDLSSGFVLVYDTRKQAIESATRVDQPGSHLVKLHPTRGTLFVSNIQGGSISELDPSKQQVLHTWKTGAGAEGFDFSPDGRSLWVGNLEEDTISVIDLRAPSEAPRKLDAPGKPIRVQFTPDGQRVLVSYRGSNDVGVFDAASRRELLRLPMDLTRIGPSGQPEPKTSVPMAIELHPEQPLAYVANSHSGVVSVFDTQALEVVGYYKAGTKPDPLALVLDAPASVDAAAWPAMAEHTTLGGAPRGVYATGKPGAQAVLPRRVDAALDGTRFAAHLPVHFPEAATAAPGSVPLDEFLTRVERSIPADVRRQLDAVVDEAQRLASLSPPLAAPFPAEDADKIRHALRMSWLHSRDLEVELTAMGYPARRTGVHDLVEPVPVSYAQQLAALPTAPAWFQRYVATLPEGGTVNASFMNPHILADVWRWTPKVAYPKAGEGAVDAKKILRDPAGERVGFGMCLHTMVPHHDNNPDGQSHPIEAALNNLDHGREDTYGVRKAPQESWWDIGSKLEVAEVGKANTYARTPLSLAISRDGAALKAALEQEGRTTPWHLLATAAE